MPTATTPPVPLPPWSIPLIDDKGMLTKEWLIYLISLDTLVRALRLEIP